MTRSPHHPPSVPMVGLVHRSPHHAEASGYARLAEFIDGMTTIDGDDSAVPYRLRRSMGSHAPGRSRNYNSSSVAKELSLIGLQIRHRHGVAHYFDAERDALAGPMLAPRLGWGTAGSFHYPPATMRDVVSLRAVRHLDAAVALASNQADFLAELLGPERVHLIPLGVDTDFFSPAPGPSARSNEHVLFVGQHLRDFEVFGHAITSLREQIPSLRVTAVLRREFHHLIPSEPWITVRAGIDDEELRGLYRSAGCLLLPLVDAAGCTAILEAMACGLPVITSDVGGTGDYVPDGSGTRCPPANPAALAEAAAAVLEATPPERARAEATARTNAMRFALPDVAARLETLLRSIGP